MSKKTFAKSIKITSAERESNRKVTKENSMQSCLKFRRYAPVAPQKVSTSQQLWGKHQKTTTIRFQSQYFKKDEPKMSVAKKSLEPQINSYFVEHDEATRGHNGLMSSKPYNSSVFSSASKIISDKMPEISKENNFTAHQSPALKTNDHVAADTIKIFQLSKSRPCTVNCRTLKTQTPPSLLRAFNPNICPSPKLVQTDTSGSNGGRAAFIFEPADRIKTCCPGILGAIPFKRKSQAVRKLLFPDDIKPESDFYRKCITVLSLTKTMENNLLTKRFKCRSKTNLRWNRTKNENSQQPNKIKSAFELAAKSLTTDEPCPPSPVLKVVLTKRKYVANSNTSTEITDLSTIQLHYFGTSIKSITDTINRFVKKRQEKQVQLPSVASENNPAAKLIRKNVQIY